MKFPVLSVVGLVAILLVACGPSEAEIAAQKEKATADSIAAAAAAEHVYVLHSGVSKAMWTGTMLGVKSHHGTINFTDGELVVQGGMITGGSFTVDMTSIAPLDTNYAPDGAEQGTKSMLIGHLSSPDFFDVASYPTATFEVTGGTMDAIVGNLTVRGKTHEEKVTDVAVSENDGMLHAKGKLTFDRQKYDVAWKAPMKDVVLNNDIELAVELTGKPQ